MTMNVSCIRKRMHHGERPRSPVKNCFRTSTACSESKTAENERAAIMIQRNMAELSSVSFRVFVKTFSVRRRLQSAIRNAASAPTAELSSSRSS